MGNNQILLLVLSTIIAGVAVAMGITHFTKDKKNAERDMVSKALISLTGKAIAWRASAASFGGGTQKDGTSSYEGFSMSNLGYQPGPDGGYDLLGNGSCFTGHSAADGEEFRAAWYPKGDCDSSTNIALKATLKGTNVDDLEVSNGGYYTEWRKH